MHPNAALIESFYRAFQRRDGAAMGGCYAPTASFRDPVFRLDGWRIGAMWRMLCERGTDLAIEFDAVEADDAMGQARWQARYSFSASSRQVHNKITARFEFQDGRIVRHVDSFSLTRWAAQALGLPGRLFGWAPPFRSRIRQRAARGLESYIRQRGLAPPDLPAGAGAP